jgi:hypothetical protein
MPSADSCWPFGVAAGVKVPDFAGERVPRPFHSSFWDRKLLPSMVTVSQ